MKCVVRKRNGKSKKTEKRKFKTADKISFLGQRRHQRTQILIQNQCLRSFIFSGFMGIYCEKPPIFEILAVLGLFVSDYHPERAVFFYAFN